jgi:threonine/homoserine/homoserine lactone efflux protein
VVFIALKFIGVAYLLFLAWKMWFASLLAVRARR